MYSEVVSKIIDLYLNINLWGGKKKFRFILK